MKSILRTLAIPLALLCALGGCVTNPPASSSNAGSGASGVTVYGTVDVGVGRSR